MKAGKKFPYVHGFLYLTIFLGMIIIGGIFIEDIAILGAIFAGIICQSIFPEKIAEKLEGNFKFLMLFIAPFFFFGVGYKVSLTAIGQNLLLIFVIIAVSMAARVGSAMFTFKKHFPKRSDRFTFGIGLCTKFSTSVIILSILLEYGYISTMIFSLIITAFLSEKVIVVFIYSFGLPRVSKELTESPVVISTEQEEKTSEEKSINKSKTS
jgi:Kef-type K+ transport system membrane component KefB